MDCLRGSPPPRRHPANAAKLPAGLRGALCLVDAARHHPARLRPRRRRPTPAHPLRLVKFWAKNFHWADMTRALLRRGQGGRQPGLAPSRRETPTEAPGFNVLLDLCTVATHPALPEGITRLAVIESCGAGSAFPAKCAPFRRRNCAGPTQAFISSTAGGVIGVTRGWTTRILLETTLARTITDTMPIGASAARVVWRNRLLCTRCSRRVGLPAWTMSRRCGCISNGPRTKSWPPPGHRVAHAHSPPRPGCAEERVPASPHPRSPGRLGRTLWHTCRTRDAGNHRDATGHSSTARSAASDWSDPGRSYPATIGRQIRPNWRYACCSCFADRRGLLRLVLIGPLAARALLGQTGSRRRPRGARLDAGLPLTCRRCRRSVLPN